MEEGGVGAAIHPVYLVLAEPVTGSRAEHHDPIRGSVGHYGLASGELELKTPLPLHLDHTHSVYVAVGTLVSAIVIVVITVRSRLIQLIG